MTLSLLCVSAYAVIEVVERSNENIDSWWRRNEITVVMSMISFIFPMLFEVLGLMEYYHPRMQLRLQLARIMILNLLNLYSLIWALFGKIANMTKRLGEIKDSQMTTLAPLVLDQPIQTSSSPSSTMQSITESAFSRISEIFNQTEYSTEPTENYDYSNTNYFEYEEPDTQQSTTIETSSVEPTQNFTESLIDFTDPFYIDNDFGNFSDFYSNITQDLFENSNFNLTNLINDSLFNNSVSSAFNTSIFNSTEVAPVASAFQSLQYSYLQHEQTSFINMDLLNDSMKSDLRKLCWETMFGQELVKLTVMDLVIRKGFIGIEVFVDFHSSQLLTVMQTLMVDFFRALFVRYMNSFWCWDLEKRFPKVRFPKLSY